MIWIDRQYFIQLDIWFGWLLFETLMPEWLFFVCHLYFLNKIKDSKGRRYQLFMRVSLEEFYFVKLLTNPLIIFSVTKWLIKLKILTGTQSWNGLDFCHKLLVWKLFLLLSSLNYRSLWRRICKVTYHHYKL